MMRRLLLISAALAVSLSAWCDTRLKPYEDYIEKYAEEAMMQQVRYGIPSSITLAQGLLESNAGNSTLAVKSNNHFGIKCHNDWKGETYSHWDDGEMSCFRKYDKVLDSYYDHSKFLVSKSRYDFLFELDVKDYKAWAKGLSQAGYATDPQYSQKLIRLIELYDLDQYDRLASHPRKNRQKSEEALEQQADEPQTAGTSTQVKAKPAKEPRIREPRVPRQGEVARRTELARQSKDYSYLIATDDYPQTIVAIQRHEILYRGSTPYIVARYGDNFQVLADEFNVTPAHIRKVNDCPKDYRMQVGDIIYLNRKCETWEGEEATHTVREGDTLHSISQLYAIRLKSLIGLNGTELADGLSVGQQLKLR